MTCRRPNSSPAGAGTTLRTSRSTAKRLEEGFDFVVAAFSCPAVTVGVELAVPNRRVGAVREQEPRAGAVSEQELSDGAVADRGGPVEGGHAPSRAPVAVGSALLEPALGMLVPADVPRGWRDAVDFGALIVCGGSECHGRRRTVILVCATALARPASSTAAA